MTEGAPRALSLDARRFLQQSIDSLEQLEILVLLYRSPERWWSADGVAAELRIGAAPATAALETLSSRNLLDARLTEDVVFRYGPVSAALDSVVREVTEAYRGRRLYVAGMVGPGGHRFDEGFRIGKKDDGS